MKTKMLIITCVSAVIAAVSYYFHKTEWCFVLAIVAFTTFYHFAIRLVIGWLVKALSEKDYNYDNLWLREKKWEKKVYKVLHVHSWKDKFPTYAPDSFDLKNGLKSVIQETAIAEIVHTVIIPLSYLPLVFAIIFSDLTDIIVFGITGLVAGLVDFLFVIVQRYNRPRLLRVMRHLESKLP